MQSACVCLCACVRLAVHSGKEIYVVITVEKVSFGEQRT